MSKYEIVTSFGPDGWSKYGKRFVESWTQFAPKSLSLTVFYHDCSLPDEAALYDNVTFKDLSQLCPAVNQWKIKNAFANGMNQQKGYNFRQDAVKFCNKVFALAQRGKELSEEKRLPYLVWLDADCYAKAPIPANMFDEILRDEPDIAYLGRLGTYAETSFLAFNLYTDSGRNLLNNLRDSYINGEIFFYTEWHDGFVFQRLLNMERLRGIAELNLSPAVQGHGSDAFNVSPVGKFFTHLKGPVAKGETGLKPIRVLPRDCVDHAEIHKNIEYNVKHIKRWAEMTDFHDMTATLASSGPTLEKHLDEIRDKKWIFCVKHSYPTLLKAGIKPFGCVILDPRDVQGVSTHDVKRTTLFEEIDSETLFFVASMTHPSVTELLLKRGANVIGWHAYSDASVSSPLLKNQPMLIGGTCAALRAISVARNFGFRDMDLYGYDFSLQQEPANIKEAKDEQGRPKYMQVGIGPSGRKWYTTGEMLAGVQDMEVLAKSPQAEYRMRVHGDSFCAEMWNLNKNWNLKSFESYLAELKYRGDAKRG